jgi:hypothetical protein
MHPSALDSRRTAYLASRGRPYSQPAGAKRTGGLAPASWVAPQPAGSGYGAGLGAELGQDMAWAAACAGQPGCTQADSGGMNSNLQTGYGQHVRARRGQRYVRQPRAACAARSSTWSKHVQRFWGHVQRLRGHVQGWETPCTSSTSIRRWRWGACR